MGSDSVPRCLNCDSSPDLARLLRQLAAEGPRSQVPPDEPFGQLNLSWPPAVPCRRSDAAGTAAEADPGTAPQPPAESPATATTQSQATTNADRPCPVYKRALRADQLRLVVFASGDTPRRGTEAESSWPVHVDLETYSDSDCPEYETVSYLWGGENGTARRAGLSTLGVPGMSSYRRKTAARCSAPSVQHMVSGLFGWTPFVSTKVILMSGNSRFRK